MLKLYRNQNVADVGTTLEATRVSVLYKAQILVDSLSKFDPFLHISCISSLAQWFFHIKFG